MGKSEKRKFKIKIRVSAEYSADDAPSNSPTFDQVVHQWYKDVGKGSLLTYLNGKDPNKPITIKYFSYVKDFEAGDTVDKETYD